jgi:hypothetical protein
MAIFVPVSGPAAAKPMKASKAVIPKFIPFSTFLKNEADALPAGDRISTGAICHDF